MVYGDLLASVVKSQIQGREEIAHSRTFAQPDHVAAALIGEQALLNGKTMQLRVVERVGNSPLLPGAACLQAARQPVRRGQGHNH